MTTDTVDTALDQPKFTPLAALTAADLDISSCALSGLGFQDCGERDAATSEDFVFQSPNLRDRLDTALAKARAAQSRIDRREWTEEAFSLIERLVDAETVCACGVACNVQTGRCDDCDERHEQLMADRARMGAMAVDVDERCGF